MDTPGSRRAPWTAHLMMVVSLVVILVVVPASFMLNGPVGAWLQSLGVRSTPNLADGRLIGEVTDIERRPSESLPTAASDARAVERALALRSFAVKKVAFRPGSGVGIAPRLNLSFEFDGELPNPHDSTKGFSLTVLHVYVAAPTPPGAPATPARPRASPRAANVDFAGPAWTHQVIIDGLHEQARVFDSQGRLLGRGIGLYVRPERGKAKAGAPGSEPPVIKTRITAALPVSLLGDPDKGDWAFYVLVGVTDSTSPTLMRHSEPGGQLGAFAGALDTPSGETTARPRLRPLILKGRV